MTMCHALHSIIQPAGPRVAAVGLGYRFEPGGAGQLWQRTANSARWCLMSEEQPVVFVVDDDPSVRDALAGLLRSVGLEVLSFGSTQEFLQSKRPDAPGCLVLDVRLPGRSGLDFQRELAESGIHLPIVFITGHGDIPMSVRAIKAGAIEFLTKPFHDQELLDAIQLGIERDRARRRDAAAVAGLQRALRLVDAARTGDHGARRDRTPEQADRSRPRA